MTVSQQEIAELINTVTEKEDQDLDFEMDLIDAGILDSLFVMELVDEIEKKYDIELDGELITAENFKSMKSIYDMLTKI